MILTGDTWWNILIFQQHNICHGFNFTYFVFIQKNWQRKIYYEIMRKVMTNEQNKWILIINNRNYNKMCTLIFYLLFLTEY